MPDATPAEVARHLSDGRTIYVLHRHADADCVAAACALAAGFGGSLWAPAGLAAAGRRVAAHCAREVATEPGERDRFLLVDVSTWGQVGDAAGVVRAGAYGLIDHHAYGDDFADAALRLRDPGRSSTCELALDVLDAARRPPAPREALALLAGLLADSGRFRWGNAASLTAALRLLEAGAAFEPALALLEEKDEDDRSSRIARMKAARRARLLEAAGRLVAVTTVGSHESAAAAGLVRLGADCALVAAPTPEGARVTGRAVAGFPVHLGEALNALARDHPEAGAAGGGHEGSAGFRAAGTPEAWLAAALDRVVQGLGEEARDL